MKRVLEPEIMGEEEQALAYAEADFSSSNQFFVDRLVEQYSSRMKNVLDLGCGPADVPVRFLRKIPSLRITAVDASAAMVKLARETVNDANLQDRVTVVNDRLPGLSLDDNDFDTIISKDMLHHLPDPAVLWNEIKRMAKGSTVVGVMDLLRPGSAQDAKAIVESVSGDEHDVLKRDFYRSLLAAFTMDEVAEQFHRLGMELSIEKVSDRHFLATGLIDGSR